MILSDEDIKFIKFAEECLNVGHYTDSRTLTDTYNRCFADRPNFKPLENTNCGSCLRQRAFELANEMHKILDDVNNE